MSIHVIIQRMLVAVKSTVGVLPVQQQPKMKVILYHMTQAAKQLKASVDAAKTKVTASFAEQEENTHGPEELDTKIISKAAEDWINYVGSLIHCIDEALVGLGEQISSSATNPSNNTPESLKRRKWLMGAKQSLTILMKELSNSAMSFIAACERASWTGKVNGMSLAVTRKIPPLLQLVQKVLTSTNKADVKATQVSALSVAEDEDEDDGEEMRRDEERRRKLQKLQIAKELSDITSISSGNFSSWTKSNLFDGCQMHSVAELTALKWRKKYPQEWDHFNVQHFSRIYPKGSRFDSSNYSPVPFWCVGCQMVSLNFQTQDIPMRLNTALFQDNGMCGYVLKPEVMRDPLCPFAPDHRPTFISSLSLTVISGSQLPVPKQSVFRKSSSQYYIQASIYGCPVDEKELKGAGATVSYLGRVVWKETFKFPIAFPELAFLVVNVMSKDECIAYFAGRVSLLKHGFRMMPLYNKKGELEPTSGLYCKVVLPRKKTK